MSPRPAPLPLTRFRALVGAASFFALVVAFSPLSAAADVPVSEKASRRFEEGVRYLRSHDPDRYEKAYREFKAAYTESPSWKILGNLGIVAQELERDGEAIDAYQKYLEGGAKELRADEKKQFKNDLALLESGLTTVTLTTLPDGAWIVDERLPEAGSPVLNRYGPTSGPLELRVRAGHHRVRAELGGHEVDTWEFSEAAGASVAHTFDLQRHEPPPSAAVAAPTATPPPTTFVDAEPKSGTSTLPILGYVSLGVGAVGLGIGTWFLWDAGQKSDDADAAWLGCSDAIQPPPDKPTCPDTAAGYLRAQSASDDEARARTSSLISLSAGGAFLATGVILLLIGSSADDGRDQVSLTPWVAPDGFGVTGSF